MNRNQNNNTDDIESSVPASSFRFNIAPMEEEEKATIVEDTPQNRNDFFNADEITKTKDSSVSNSIHIPIPGATTADAEDFDFIYSDFNENNLEYEKKVEIEDTVEDNENIEVEDIIEDNEIEDTIEDNEIEDIIESNENIEDIIESNEIEDTIEDNEIEDTVEDNENIEVY